MKILVVEDEERLCASLCKGLRLQGYAVDYTFRGDEAARLCYDNEYDLIVLDINLPGLDGFGVLKAVREHSLEVNIIMLTAASGVESKVTGLDLGANDYLTKPFHFEELNARIRSLLRRKTVLEGAVIRVRGLEFDTRSHTANAFGVQIALTAKESSILQYLILKRGCIVSQQELINHVWDNSVDEFSNSVRMHMSSLRKKLAAVLKEDIIESVIGKGYIIREGVAQ